MTQTTEGTGPGSVERVFPRIINQVKSSNIAENAITEGKLTETLLRETLGVTSVNGMTGDVTIEAGGGAVTSVNGQTGDVALGFSEISTTSTYTNFLPEGGDLSIALQDIDSALTGKMDATSTPQFDSVAFQGGGEDTVLSHDSLLMSDVTLNYMTGITLTGGAGITFADDSVQTTAGAALSHAHWVTPPTAADSTGTAGDTAYDSSYFYICTATDTWRRIAHQTW